MTEQRQNQIDIDNNEPRPAGQGLNPTDNGRRHDRNLYGPAAIVAAGLLGAGLLLSNGGGKEANTSNTSSGSIPGASGLLATPDSSSAAAGTPEPSASAEANVQSLTMQVGEKAFFPAGTIISGDVAIADQDGGQIFRLYDIDTDKALGVTDNTQTALLVNMQQPGEVYAPYGAFVVTGLPQDRAAMELQLLQGEKQGSVARVDVVNWTGFATTINETGKTAAQDTSAVMAPDALAQQGGLTQPFESMQPGAQPSESAQPIASQGTIVTLPNGEQFVININTNSNCGCETPAPKPTPTPECSATPAPTPTPEIQSQCVPMYDDFLKKGEKVTLKGKDFLVEGDVYIDGVRHFDNNASTGAIDKELNGGTHTVYAPYGADVQVFNSCATEQDKQNTYNKDLQQLRSSGRTLDPNSLN